MPTLILDPMDGTLPLTLAWQDGYQVRPAPTGLKLPPRDVLGQALPHGGESHRGVRVLPRQVMVPLDVWADDRGTYLARERRLFDILHRETPVRFLHVEDDTGTTYYADGYYMSGVEGAGGPEMTAGVYGVLMRFPDPYWRGPALVREWTPPLPSGTGFFPFFPLTLGRSTIEDRQTVTNLGSEKSYGLWTLTGPCTTGTSLTNLTHGGVLQLSTVMGVGEQRIIDMTPGRQSVRDQFGSSMFHEITGSPVMWPLLPGVNEISVVMPGSTAASRVSVSFDTVFAAV